MEPWIDRSVSFFAPFTDLEQDSGPDGARHECVLKDVHPFHTD